MFEQLLDDVYHIAMMAAAAAFLCIYSRKK
jgi:hypothetical protein